MKQLNSQEITSISGGLIYLGYGIYMPDKHVSKPCIEDLNKQFHLFSHLLIEGQVTSEAFGDYLNENTRCTPADTLPLRENSKSMFVIGIG